MSRKPLPKFVVISDVVKSDKYGEQFVEKGWSITPKEADLVYLNQKSLVAFVAGRDNDVESPVEVRKMGWQKNRILAIPFRKSDRELMFGESKASLLLSKMDEIEVFLYENDPVFKNMIEKREEEERKEAEEAKILAELEQEEAKLKEAA